MAMPGEAPPEGLAEVKRVRQFFPETWIWRDITTDESGRAVVPVEAPDSITTWMLRAVGMSKEHGLGIGEGQLRVFQPFFLTVDLPFSAIRGEEFPIKIALFNYLDSPQEIFVEIEGSDEFDLLDAPLKSITIEANDIGGAQFMIRPKGLGSNPVKITARSTEAAGFLHHQELLGGLQGRDALTAYVATANAVSYLEGRLGEIDDPYTMAITAYALELAGSGLKHTAYDKLMAMAQIDDNGALYWGGGGLPIEPYSEDRRTARHGNQSAAIETTGYALLALLHHEDLVSASRTAKWLVGQRNALGGFGSTQDTIVGLYGLTTFSTKVRTNVDMTVVLESDTWRKEVRITPENGDVLQTVQVPLGEVIAVTAVGKGDAVLQSVLRYNVPERRTEISDVFDITVDYGTDHVQVDDLITVSASVTFTPPTPIKAGMVVLDAAMPTGFEPVRETVGELVEENANLKRFEIAGRKVILYIEDMLPGETVSFGFQARAKYPVRAKEVVSQVYSYYRPEHRGETLGGAMTVTH